ncbi:MAG: hypothetical protein AAF320_05075 [Myxococcota bacterium]
MNALFWLLALAGAASFLPNLYKTGQGQHILLTPVLLCVGYALSPSGLGFIAPAAVRGMQPAVQLFITWIALCAGMHVPHPRLWLRYRGALFRRLGTSALMAAWVSLGTGALLVMTQLILVGRRSELGSLLQEKTAVMAMAWGCLLAGSQVGLRIWQQGLLAFVSAVLVSNLTMHQVGLLLVVCAGCTAAAALLQRWGEIIVCCIVFIGVASLSAGLSQQLDLPHVCTGFAVGFCLSLVSKQSFEQRRWVSQASVPAQVVVIVLVGLTVQVPWAALAWGICLSIVLVLMRFAKTASRLTFEITPMSLVYGHAARCTAFAAALLFAGGRAHSPAQLLLVITAVAASLSDLVIWFAIRYRNKTCGVKTS